MENTLPGAQNVPKKCPRRVPMGLPAAPRGARLEPDCGAKVGPEGPHAKNHLPLEAQGGPEVPQGAPRCDFGLKRKGDLDGAKIKKRSNGTS